MRRAGLVTMAALIVACGFPRETWAGDEARRTNYAKREAESQGLQDFRGGCPGPDGVTLVVALLLAPVILPLYGIYLGVEWFVGLFSHDEKPERPRTVAPPKEPAWVPTPGASHP